jgi:hypothetical protein
MTFNWQTMGDQRLTTSFNRGASRQRSTISALVPGAVFNRAHDWLNIVAVVIIAREIDSREDHAGLPVRPV